MLLDANTVVSSLDLAIADPLIILRCKSCEVHKELPMSFINLSNLRIAPLFDGIDAVYVLANVKGEAVPILLSLTR